MDGSKKDAPDSVSDLLEPDDERLEATDVVRAYKRLSEVERAFRISKDFARRERRGR